MSQNNQPFLKLMKNERVEWLLMKHPNAFLLLTQIAMRARRTTNSPDGLEIGEAFIGDYWNCGIESEKKYRIAKDKLIIERAVKIVETCRNRKKGATGTTTVGTKVKLLNSEFYDINPESEGDRKGDRGATEGRPKGDEQEGKKVKKERMSSIVCADAENDFKIIFPKHGNGALSMKKSELIQKLSEMPEGFSEIEISKAIQVVLEKKDFPKLKCTIEKYVAGIILQNRKSEKIQKAISVKECKKKKVSSMEPKEKKLEPYDRSKLKRFTNEELDELFKAGGHNTPNNNQKKEQI